MLFGHLIRMDESADARRILTAVPQSDWRRPVGRPHSSRMATLKNDLSLHNLTFEDAIEMALDKPLWGLLAASGAIRTDGACRIMMMIGSIIHHAPAGVGVGGEVRRGEAVIVLRRPHRVCSSATTTTRRQTQQLHRVPFHYLSHLRKTVTDFRFSSLINYGKKLATKLIKLPVTPVRCRYTTW